MLSLLVLLRARSIAYNNRSYLYIILSRGRGNNLLGHEPFQMGRGTCEQNARESAGGGVEVRRNAGGEKWWRVERRGEKKRRASVHMCDRERERERVEKDSRCAVTACDNSREIVSFIADVITIIVILRVSTAIS